MDLSKADLIRVDLTGANLHRANLSRANLAEANLSRANLSEANLSNADMASARLQQTILLDATVTDIALWETQRDGWIIKGILCERAYWGPERTAAVQYAPGEFEKLHSDLPHIELHYLGGITTFQLNTLPLLLYRLVEDNSGSTVRLSRLEEAPGGTKIVINVEEGDPSSLQANILRFQELQIKASLNEQHAARMEALLKSMTAQFFDSLPRMLEAASMKTNNFNAPVNSYVEGGSHHIINSNQPVDESAIKAIANEARQRAAELRLLVEESQQLQTALANLDQPQQHPNSVVKDSILSLKNIFENAVGGIVSQGIPSWMPHLLHNIEAVLRGLGT